MISAKVPIWKWIVEPPKISFSVASILCGDLSLHNAVAGFGRFCLGCVVSVFGYYEICQKYDRRFRNKKKFQRVAFSTKIQNK